MPPPDPEYSLQKTDSKVSITDSSYSAASSYEPYGQPRKSRSVSIAVSVADSTNSNFSNTTNNNNGGFNFAEKRKTRQSFGAYTSLFARKLLPPLGFYRESDKYAQLRSKFKDDDLKAEAVDEMWADYQKYQVRKRFRWPPRIICKKFFWTTGYYADYQKLHRATKLRQPGEDSSDDEEFVDPAGQYMVQQGDDDINMTEFDRYREAKKNAVPGIPRQKRPTRFNLGEDPGSYLVDRRPTVSRLFEEDDQKKGASKEVEEVETIVEYALIRDPNKKKRRSLAEGGKKRKKKDKSKKDKDGEPQVQDTFDGMAFDELEAGVNKRLVSRRKSVAKVDRDTGEKVMDVEESTEVVDGATGSVKEKSRRKSKVKL